MSEKPRTKSAAPGDPEMFAEACRPALRSATADLSWLLTRGYALASALKLVGDRHGLVKRQREAVMRCSAADDAVRRRRECELDLAAVRGVRLAIDGFNLLTTLETALGGGAIFRGRDGCLRDVAGVHGTWRRGPQTPRAIEAVLTTLAGVGPESVVWILDRPVSNSGRLAAMISEATRSAPCAHEVEVCANADERLLRDGDVVATADAEVIEGSSGWVNLADAVLRNSIPEAWLVDLSENDS